MRSSTYLELSLIGLSFSSSDDSSSRSLSSADTKKKLQLALTQTKHGLVFDYKNNPNDFNNEFAEDLAELLTSDKQFKKIKTLRLANTSVTEIGIWKITEALKTHKHVVAIDFENTAKLNDGGILSIARLISANPKITRVNIEGKNNVTEEGGKMLAEHVFKREMLEEKLKEDNFVPEKLQIKLVDRFAELAMGYYKALNKLRAEHEIIKEYDIKYENRAFNDQKQQAERPSIVRY